MYNLLYIIYTIPVLLFLFTLNFNYKQLKKNLKEYLTIRSA